ncbi:hypothetical protein Bhyg_11229 [Pseudolycoriella hygida]|uniref:Uncharacterized protein n=1 Tax=Pseudolycoriella hygida TaxID=35572 RepID=A0A9Q0MWC7_9DIPT|nr:hypothetical protein Bhyg_11229 [Pseudolycoriella hygida]
MQKISRNERRKKHKITR